MAFAVDARSKMPVIIDLIDTMIVKLDDRFFFNFSKFQIK